MIFILKQAFKKYLLIRHLLFCISQTCHSFSFQNTSWNTLVLLDPALMDDFLFHFPSCVQLYMRFLTMQTFRPQKNYDTNLAKNKWNINVRQWLFRNNVNDKQEDIYSILVLSSLIKILEDIIYIGEGSHLCQGRGVESSM